MKKVVCGILATIMTLSLCACDGNTKAKKPERDDEDDSRYEEEYTAKPKDFMEENNDFTDETEPFLPTEPEIPSDEDMSVMSQYANLVDEIRRHTCFELDNQQRQDIYEQMQAMDAVDKWYGTEYASLEYVRERGYASASYFNEETDWNRQYIMRQLYTVEDVYLYTNHTTIDSLGNTSTSRLYNGQENHYYADGTLRHVQSERTGLGLPLKDETNIYCVDVQDIAYDENGNIVKKVSRNDDYVSLIQTLTYNQDGQLTQLVSKTNMAEQTLNYTYDEAGRLCAITWNALYSSAKYEMLYTYDEEGKLLQEQYSKFDGNSVDDRTILHYQYDEDGKLVSSTYRDQDFIFGDLWGETVHEHQYTLDSRDRVASVTVDTGMYLYYDDNGEVSRSNELNNNTNIYEYVYGTYYGICNLSEDA